MAERKVLNKYFPPGTFPPFFRALTLADRRHADFDPSKIPRRKMPKDSQMTVRLMAPFTMSCNTCGEFICMSGVFFVKGPCVLTGCRQGEKVQCQEGDGAGRRVLRDQDLSFLHCAFRAASSLPRALLTSYRNARDVRPRSRSRRIPRMQTTSANTARNVTSR